MLIHALALAIAPQGATQIPNVPSRSAVAPTLRIEDHAIQSHWCPNGPVSDIEFDGDTMYVSGGFEAFGRYTGPFVSLDPATGEATLSPHFIDGRVEEVCDDGAGGWYIAGPFSIPGSNAYGLARLRADGTIVDYTATRAVDQVNVLLRDGNTLYVGGRFTTAFGATRRGLAALDITTDTLLPYDPLSPLFSGQPNEVSALEVIDGELFVGGQLDLGGPPAFLATFDLASGALVWQPTVQGFVYALAFDNDHIYFGGSFVHVEQIPRSNLAAVRRSDRALTAFAPAVDGWIGSLLRSGDRLIVGGGFSNVGMEPRSRLASFDVNTGLLTSWDPAVTEATGAGDDVLDLAEVGNAIAVVGAFRSVAGVQRSCFAVVDRDLPITLSQRADVAYSGAPVVDCVAAANGVIAIGGRFEMIAERESRGIAALDARTGRPRRAFQPNIESRQGPGSPVSAGDIIVLDDKLLIVGSQYKVDGVTRKHIAALDKVTGRLIPSFNAGFDGPPNGMWIDDSLHVDDQVYVVGAFDTPDPAYSDFVALDADTGRLVPDFRPALQGRIYSIARSDDGSTLYAGGPPFQAGTPFVDRNRLAAFDAVTGALLPWDPGASDSVYMLRVDGDRLYVGGAFFSIAGLVRPRLAAFDVPTGMVLPWNAGILGPEVHTVQRFQNELLVGGQVDVMGGAPRRGCGALHIQLGVALAWNPNPGSSVSTIRQGPFGVAIGGNFRATSASPRQYLAVYPVYY